MNFPSNYSLNGYSNDGNTVSAIRSDSSLKIRLDATFSRKIASFNVGTGVYSVPTVDVVFRRDVANEEGNPIGQRASAAIGFRLPVAVTEAALDDLIADIRAYINDTELKSNLLHQRLPTCCTDEP